MAADSTLTSMLNSRGFAVMHKLKGGGTCQGIFCVSAKSDPNGELCAAKVVSLAGLDKKEFRSAEQEVSFLKGIPAHPNLVEFRNSFIVEEGPTARLIIVMSYAEDGDLRLAVKESLDLHRTIPVLVVLAWVQQMLLGLSHLQSQGVLHRDIKSSNIFLSRGRRHLQIGDFGLSRVLESVSFAESCVGTPAYMSPEVMQGEKYDYHADMWACGCICYELCTLQLPFTGNSIMEIYEQVTEKEPDWDCWAGFSDDLCDITRRLLQKDASRRPMASAILEEEPFLSGRRGAFDVPDEDWACVALQKPGEVDCGGALDKLSLSSLSTTVGSGSSAPTTLDSAQALNMDLSEFQKMMSAECGDCTGASVGEDSVLE